MNIETYVASLPIPGDSPSISGVYLEQIIPGYRTIRTEGRWNLASDVSETDRSADWTKMKGKRYKPKDFIVTFAITCNTPQNLHAATRKLRGFLHQKREEFKLIFRDEETIFYTGIVSDIQGSKLVNDCSVSGQFTIHCADGRGYSTQEYEIDAILDGDTTYFNVDYQGTAEAYPVLEANIKSDTGFVGFLTEDGKIIQIGDPNAQKEVGNSLVNHSFKGGNLQGWTRNTYTPKAVGDRTFSATGSVKSVNEGIAIDSAGSGDNYHGPLYMYSLNEPAMNFEAAINYVLNMNTGVTNVGGGMDIILLGHDDGESTQYEVARLSIYKADDQTSVARIELVVDGKVVERKEFKMDDPSSNIYTGKSIKIN
jgi:predicted phage tail component-like protein